MKTTGKAIVMLLLLSALFSSAVYAHADNVGVWEKLGIPDPVNILIVGAGMSAFFIIVSVYYRKHMGEKAKKLAFIFIAVPVVISTIYVSASTVYLNVTSATGGPVHWHADYEVWVCGERHELIDPTGFENRVGTPTVHEHNDNRIHIEGVLLDLEDASLHEYFESIGGEFEDDLLTMPTHEGLMTWKNGDLCNGRPAQWHVFVNGNLAENGHEHIIAPYSTVPPGDVIKIVFTEKVPNLINTKLFEAP